jgi:hypothetical protein
VAKDGIGPMRYVGLAEVAFCLLVSAGPLIAQWSGPGQAEYSRSEVRKDGAANVSNQVAEEAFARQAVTVAQLMDAVEDGLTHSPRTIN